MRQARRQHDKRGGNPTKEADPDRYGQIEILARKASSGIRADEEAVGSFLADGSCLLSGW